MLFITAMTHLTSLSTILCAIIVNTTIPILASEPSLIDQQKTIEAHSNKIIFLDGNDNDLDSIRREITAFYYEQYRHCQDPGAPYFLFMSKDAQLAMGIGGAVRMRAYYDWDGAMPSSAFTPFQISIPANPTNMQHFGSTPSGTCLYFRVLGRNKLFNRYQLYIETDFTGYEHLDLRLKKAYAIIDKVTIGYAASTYSDPSALPPIVDGQGVNNKISPTSVLLRYTPVFRNKWHLSISIETPTSAIDADNVNTQKVSDKMPDFAAAIQYQWSAGQHIRLAGIVRSLPYRDLINATNHSLAGYGLLFSIVATPTKHLTFYGTANYGRGIGSLGGDLIFGSYDLVDATETPGRMYAPRAYGYCAAVQYNFKPNLFASISASQYRYLPKNYVAPEEYKYGLFAACNVFWNITPRLQVAVEFDFGKRHNFSSMQRNAYRFNSMCMFSF